MQTSEASLNQPNSVSSQNDSLFSDGFTHLFHYQQRGHLPCFAYFPILQPLGLRFHVPLAQTSDFLQPRHILSFDAWNSDTFTEFHTGSDTTLEDVRSNSSTSNIASSLASIAINSNTLNSENQKFNHLITSSQFSTIAQSPLTSEDAVVGYNRGIETADKSLPTQIESPQIESEPEKSTRSQKTQSKSKARTSATQKSTSKKSRKSTAKKSTAKKSTAKKSTAKSLPSVTETIAVSAPVQYQDVPPPQPGEHPAVLDCRENAYIIDESTVDKIVNKSTTKKTKASSRKSTNQSGKSKTRSKESQSKIPGTAKPRKSTTQSKISETDLDVSPTFSQQKIGSAVENLLQLSESGQFSQFHFSVASPEAIIVSRMLESLQAQYQNQMEEGVQKADTKLSHIEFTTTNLTEQQIRNQALPEAFDLQNIEILDTAVPSLKYEDAPSPSARVRPSVSYLLEKHYIEHYAKPEISNPGEQITSTKTPTEVTANSSHFVDSVNPEIDRRIDSSVVQSLAQSSTVPQLKGTSDEDLSFGETTIHLTSVSQVSEPLAHLDTKPLPDADTPDTKVSLQSDLSKPDVRTDESDVSKDVSKSVVIASAQISPTQTNAKAQLENPIESDSSLGSLIRQTHSNSESLELLSSISEALLLPGTQVGDIETDTISSTVPVSKTLPLNAKENASSPIGSATLLSDSTSAPQLDSLTDITPLETTTLRFEKTLLPSDEVASNDVTSNELISEIDFPMSSSLNEPPDLESSETFLLTEGKLFHQDKIHNSDKLPDPNEMLNAGKLDEDEILETDSALGLTISDTSISGFQQIDRHSLPQGYATGGQVAATPSSPSQLHPSDTVPAMLTPGEFVVRAEDAQKNLPLLEHINQGGSVEAVSLSSATPLSSSHRHKIARASLPSDALAHHQDTFSRLSEAYTSTPMIFRSSDHVGRSSTGARASFSSSTSSSKAWMEEDKSWQSSGMQDLLSMSVTGQGTQSHTGGTWESSPLSGLSATQMLIHRQASVQGFASGGEVRSAPQQHSVSDVISRDIDFLGPVEEDGEDYDRLEIESLAQEVYQRLRQRLEIEQERMGSFGSRLSW